MKLSCVGRRIFVGVMFFWSRATFAMQPVTTACVGFDEKLAIMSEAVDSLSREIALQSHELAVCSNDVRSSDSPYSSGDSDNSDNRYHPKIVKVFADITARQSKIEKELLTMKPMLGHVIKAVEVRSVATEISGNEIEASTSDVAVKKEVKLAKADKDETTSNHSDEHFSAEVEIGKKGGWFHCKTACKSKTIAQHSATAVCGIIAGLLL